MAFLGLSGDALTFLGGVATGASKEIDRQLERQQEAIKEASSTAIRARLAGRKKYDDNIAEMTKAIKPLLAQYNISNVAQLMNMPELQRNKIVASLASINGKDERGTFFKALKEFDGKTPLTSSELISSLVPAYAESKLDLSGLIPNTAVDVLFGTKPSDKLERRITAGTGALRTKTPTIDLSQYTGELTQEGKIRAFSNDPKDVDKYNKFTSDYLFNKMGGKTVLEAGQYRDVPSQDGDRQIANSYSLIIGNTYSQLVRKLQITDKLSLEEAEAQAKIRISNILNESFIGGDVQNNRKIMMDATSSKIKKGVDPLQGYSSLLKGESLVKENTRLGINKIEQAIIALDKNSINIDRNVKREYSEKVEKILRSQGYTETEINKIIELFLARINKYLSGE